MCYPLDCMAVDRLSGLFVTFMQEELFLRWKKTVSWIGLEWDPAWVVLEPVVSSGGLLKPPLRTWGWLVAI